MYSTQVDDEESSYQNAALTGRSGSITVKKCVGASCFPTNEDRDFGSGGYYDDED